MANELFDEYGHPIQVIVDPANPAQLFDAYGRPFIAYEDPSGISLVVHRYEYSVNISFWNHYKVGSGTGWSDGPNFCVVTGTTTGSSSTAESSVMNACRPGKAYNRFDYDKPFMLKGSFHVQAPTANCIQRIQLKQVTTLGDLAAKGVGLKCIAGALYAESYGTSRKETSLSMTLTTSIRYGFLIVHTPGVSIKFYIDSGTGWVLKYTETDTAKIPSGESGGEPYLYADCENGASVTNTGIYFGMLQLAVAVPKA
jgi:hypothetical protein